MSGSQRKRHNADTGNEARQANQFETGQQKLTHDCLPLIAIGLTTSRWFGERLPMTFSGAEGGGQSPPPGRKDGSQSQGSERVKNGSFGRRRKAVFRERRPAKPSLSLDFRLACWFGDRSRPQKTTPRFKRGART